MQSMDMWLQTATTWLHTVVSIATYSFSVICSFMQDFSSHWWYISRCLLLLCIDLYFGGLDPLQYPWVMTFSWCTYIRVSDAHANGSPVVAPTACCAHYIILLSWAETFTIPCFLVLLHSRERNLRIFWEKEELPASCSSQRKMKKKKHPGTMFVLMHCAPKKCSTKELMQ